MATDPDNVIETPFSKSTTYHARIVPWRRACPKCGAEAGIQCFALSDEDALEEKNWQIMPAMRGFYFSFTSMAHVERFRPE